MPHSAEYWYDTHLRIQHIASLTQTVISWTHCRMELYSLQGGGSRSSVVEQDADTDPDPHSSEIIYLRGSKSAKFL